MFGLEGASWSSLLAFDSEFKIGSGVSALIVLLVGAIVVVISIQISFWYGGFWEYMSLSCGIVL